VDVDSLIKAAKSSSLRSTSEPDPFVRCSRSSVAFPKLAMMTVDPVATLSREYLAKVNKEASVSFCH
jgi:hypothetical protein